MPFQRFMRPWTAHCLLLALCLTPIRAQSAVDPDQLFAANRFEEARAAYQSALKQNPSRLTVRLGLIRTLLRLDRWTEALTSAQAAVKVAPQNPDALGMLALALMRAGQPDEAASVVARLSALKTDSYWALTAEGWVANWNGQEDQALQALRQAVTLQPKWPEAWYFLVSVTTSKNVVTSQDLSDLNHYLVLKAKGQPHSLATEVLPTRLPLVNTFVKSPPYQALEPSTEAQYQEADQGRQADIVITLPIERSDGYIIMPIELEGKKLRLLFDTGGGSDITINQSVADALKLTKLANSEVYGVSGKEAAGIYLASRLKIGGQTFGPIPVESVKNSVGPFDGILGVSAFDHFVISVDLEHNKMTLTRGKTAASPPAAPGNRSFALPFHYVETDILIPIAVDDKPAWALVDTGADNYALLSLRLARRIAAKRHKGTYAETDIDGKLGIGTSETKQRALGFVEPVSLKVAGPPQSGGDFAVKIKDAFGLSLLDKRISPASNYELGSLLGISFLMTAERVTFDYPHRLLTLELPVPPETEKPKTAGNGKKGN